MDADDLRERARISARLKALRWLLAHPQPANNQLGYKVEPISTKELATRWDGLRENGITASMLGRSERMERETRRMELYTIAEALGLPRDYFTREDPLSVVTEPPEAGRPPGPPDELFHRLGDGRPKPDTGQGGHSRRDRDARRGNG